MLLSSQTKFLVDPQAGYGKDCYVSILFSLFYPGMRLGHISQTPLH